MPRKILILGASYGSLLGTKLLMAGHDVTLVCRAQTAALFNAEGSKVRIKLRGEDAHREFHSHDLPGTLDAKAPDQVDPAGYDMVALAMSEPQYGHGDIRALMERIAAARKPAVSIMNMPPLPYLQRISGLDVSGLVGAFNNTSGWEDFAPGLVTLCSPDPQAFRPPEEKPNVLHVGLPTNFKSAPFGDPAHTAILRELADDIDAVRVDGQEVPVKLRVHDSLFVPFAKWAMLLTGNYRCVLPDGVQPIRDAVLSDRGASQDVYQTVCNIVDRLGADAESHVPFEKYAKAAENLLKPSSAARAIDAGADRIERVDLLVQLVGRQVGITHPLIDQVVDTVSRRLEANGKSSA
ncbi:ketopantoate reductase family protein [Pseudaestuariivita atlantica]|uniref:Acetyl-CoA carboxylase n=1 Tax=Pseudaestuariivita atlantica TaxID=1317121 RepID=A0A0L1JS50_9RHOB|nr:2-dehydropantoate 2-reductase N-terminal domain-containing protein [Pseudaestuariivita atlantica]KNG94561.1 acetyl-CoA carboxylase [Pseudaestuariivita atlantica]